MGNFRQILTELSTRDMPIFSFPDDNLGKHQWIFTKLGMCIDIVEIWFGIANVQITLNFDRVICPRQFHILFPDDNLSKCQRDITKLGTCIDMKEVWFLIANWQISSVFDRLICPRNTIMAGYYIV